MGFMQWGGWNAAGSAAMRAIVAPGSLGDTLHRQAVRKAGSVLSMPKLKQQAKLAVDMTAECAEVTHGSSRHSIWSS